MKWVIAELQTDAENSDTNDDGELIPRQVWVRLPDLEFVGNRAQAYEWFRSEIGYEFPITDPSRKHDLRLIDESAVGQQT